MCCIPGCVDMSTEKGLGDSGTRRLGEEGERGRLGEGENAASKILKE